MEMTAAARRYNLHFLGTVFIYAVLLTGATWLGKHFEITGLGLVALSILPALAITASLVVMGRYLVEETDEYVRRRAVTAMLFGVAVLLSISTALGFLQQRDAISGIDLLWAFPAWCVIYGVTQGCLAMRDSKAADGE